MLPGLLARIHGRIERDVVARLRVLGFTPIARAAPDCPLTKDLSVERLLLPNMDSVPLIVAIAVFVAIVAVYAAYELGRSGAGKVRERITVPPVEVMLEYRNATGFTSLRRIRILGYLPRRAGRSCLFALCNGGTAPRMFRIDRIISLATLDGQIIETRRFLAETLGVTA
jgi:hypothetical protein